MRHKHLPAIVLLLLFAFVASLAATDVLSYHNDLQSTGQNLTETQLTPANLTVGTFAKKFTTTTFGQIFAQPLYKAGVNITVGASPGPHDTIYVATTYLTVHAIDATNGAVLWNRYLYDDGLPGSTGVYPAFLLSTPVIDPATNILYVLSQAYQTIAGDPPDDLHAVTMLYGVDLGSGAIVRRAVVSDTYRVGGPYGTFSFRSDPDPTAPQDPYVFGTGDGAVVVGGTSRVYFNSFRQIVRPGLTLFDGDIYIASASYGDTDPYHGWVLRYDATTMALKGVFNTTPNGAQGGIWQSGGIISVDADGYLYCISGNGTFDGDMDTNGQTIGLNAQGFPINGNYSNCLLKLSRDATATQANPNQNGWGLKVVDYFSPYNNRALSASDTDLGSGGATILPDSVGSAAHPHLLVFGGKDGTVFLIDRDNLGKFDATTDHVVQEMGYALTASFDTAAYYNGKVYFVDAFFGGVAKTFDIANGMLSPASSSSLDNYGYPGCTPVISANGNTNAIVWTIDRNTRQLRAYDAASFGTQLWTSAMAGSRDVIGSPINTFVVPVVADGRVIVGTADSVVVYGPPAAPTALPAAPTGLIATTTSGVQISLTWDENADNEDGYRVEKSLDGVSFTEAGTTGVNTSSFVVPGLTPGTPYYFRVRSYNTLGLSMYSNVVNALTSSQPPAIDFSNGFNSSSGLLNYNGSAAVVNARTRLTGGATDNEGGSVWTITPQNAASFSTQFTFQIGSPAAGEGFTFCIQNAGNTSVVSGAGKLGYQGIGSSVAVKFQFNGAFSRTGLYTNGVQPSANSIDLSAYNLNFKTGDIFKVRLDYDGTTLTEKITDTFTNATVTLTYTIDIPATIGGPVGYVGFTGGTGTSKAKQDLLTWSYFLAPTTPPAAPTNLAVAPTSGTQVRLTWQDNADNEDGFIIQRKTGAGGTYAQIATIGANATQFIDGQLTPTATYFYRVSATNSIGTSNASNEGQVTLPIAPEAPGNFRVTAATPNLVSIAWDLAPTADGYAVLRMHGTQTEFVRIASSAPDATQSLPSNATSYNDPAVLPGVTYQYIVQAFNIAGNTVSYLNVTTPTKAAIVAAGGPVQEGAAGTATFTVSRLGETGDPLTVDYQLATGAGQAAYGIRYSLSPAPSSVTIPAGALSAVIVLTPADDPAVLGPQNVTLNLIPGPGYALNVNASATVEILDTPPNAPTNLTGMPVSGTQINLAWTDNANNEEGFVIRRKTGAGGTFSPVGTVGVNATTYIDSGLTPDTAYFYEVYATNVKGSSSATNPLAVTTPYAPAAPGFLLATAAPSTHVGLFWANVAVNADGNKVLRRVVGESGWTELASLAPGAVAYTDGTVQAGVTYEYVIRAYNIAGAGETTLVVRTLTKVGIVVVGGPVREGVAGTATFTVSRLGETGEALTVTYTLATGAGQAAYGTRYTLAPAAPAVMIPAGASSAEIVLTPGNDLAVLGVQTATLNLVAGAGYEVDTAASASVQILDAPLNAPTNLTATAVSGTQVSLAWVDNANNEAGYIIERKTGAGGSYGQVGTVGAAMTMAADSGLMPNTTYIYRVLATNAGGLSAPSNEFPITTPFAPAPPENLVTSGVTSSAVSLTWANAAVNAEGNRVLRRVAAEGGAYAELASLAPAATAYTDNSAQPGIAYEYVIRAYNLAGAGDVALTVRTLTWVGIVAVGGPVQEGVAGPATFTVSRLGETGEALTVTYALATGAGQAAYGTRYTLAPAPSAVTIPVGASSAEIVLTPGGDLAVLGMQAATLTLVAGSGYEVDTAATAVVQILDTPINVWKIQRFGSVAAAQAPEADDAASPSGDGISNLMKYALGMDPHILALLPNAVVETDESSDSYLTWTVVRPSPIPTDITYHFEMTRDLALGIWTPAAVLYGYPVDNGNGTETIAVSDLMPIPANPQGFLRLRISRP